MRGEDLLRANNRRMHLNKHPALFVRQKRQNRTTFPLRRIRHKAHTSGKRTSNVLPMLWQREHCGMGNQMPEDW
jgi:hypothetical protein